MMLAIVAALSLSQAPTLVEEEALASTPWGMSVQLAEGVGAYCSTSGCLMTGPIRFAPLTTFGQAYLGQQLLCLGGTKSGADCSSGAELRWNPNAVLLENVGGGGIFQILGTTGTMNGSLVSTASAAAAFSATGTGYVQLAGVAHASLPTCNAGTKGSLHFDTTDGAYKQCTDFATGSYHWGQLSVSTLSGYNSLTVAGADVVAENRIYPFVTPVRLGVVTMTAGTGAGTFTVEARDATANAQMCITGTIACTTAAGGYNGIDCMGSGVATAAVGSDVLIRINASGCTLAPLVNASLAYY